MRLRVTGFSQAEYYYALSNKGMKYPIKTTASLKKSILQLRLIMTRHELYCKT